MTKTPTAAMNTNWSRKAGDEPMAASMASAVIPPPATVEAINRRRARRCKSMAPNAIDLRDGMLVRIGGGGFSEAETDISIQEWLGQRDWVKAPADACVASEAWYMGERIEAE